MAVAVNITENDHVFIGKTKDLKFLLYTDHNQTEALDAEGFGLQFDVRLTDRADKVFITKQTGLGSPAEIEVIGVFNSDPAQNTQFIVVHLLRADTYDESVSPPEILVRPNIYRYSLDRTDGGSETVHTFGELVVLQSAVR